MKKVVLFLCMAAVLSQSLKAQIITNNDRVESNFAVTMFPCGFGVGYEQRIGKHFSLTGRVGMDPMSWDYNITFANAIVSKESAWSISLEPRLYVNYERRARLGKSTSHNSADFVALKIGTIAGVPNVAPYYGIRRALNKHIYNELALGVNFLYILPLPLIQYRIGISF